MTRRESALALVDAERDWQEANRMLTAAHSSCPDMLRLTALMEEVGEVARCFNDGEIEGCRELRDELVQVAAVCVAWIEALS